MEEETVAAVETPVEAPPVETPPAETAPVEATEPVIEAPLDPNDPMAALEAAMKAELPDEPAEGTPEAAIPAGFEHVFEVSDFVKSPEHVEQAIRAADEVWKVANGQAQASGLLEGMRTANPEGFKSVIENLVPYLEQVMGQKFGPPTEPPDPNQARMAAIEQRFAQEDQQRQQTAYNAQVTRAGTVAMEAVTGALKGTFAEGNEAYMLQQCAAKTGIPEDQMVKLLLDGKTDKLLSAVKRVQKEEIGRLKVYNANLIKKSRTLQNAVPATKGSTRTPTNGSKFKAKPGESLADQAVRLWNQGQ